MKDKLILILFAVIVIVCGFGIFEAFRAKNARADYSVAVQNIKAYESQFDSLNEQNKVFQFTIEQLQYTNDSSLKQLDSVRKQLKIKDNKIKQMGKIKEYVYVNDSVVIRDTVFRYKDFVMDTCMGDKWYQTCLHLEYPNKISSETSVNTDQSVFLHVTRETINPPCKTWLGRLFQRKHDVYNVTVKEQNPYVSVKENKFVIINK